MNSELIKQAIIDIEDGCDLSHIAHDYELFNEGIHPAMHLGSEIPFTMSLDEYQDWEHLEQHDNCTKQDMIEWFKSIVKGIDSKSPIAALIEEIFIKNEDITIYYNGLNIIASGIIIPDHSMAQVKIVETSNQEVLLDYSVEMKHMSIILNAIDEVLNND